jgi:hypothetical protein
MDVGQRRSGVADVGRAGLAEQADLKDLGGLGQRRLRGDEVDGRAGDQLPHRGDRLTRLPVRRQPVSEGLGVDGGIVDVDCRQGAHRAGDGDPVTGR